MTPAFDRDRLTSLIEAERELFAGGHPRSRELFVEARRNLPDLITSMAAGARAAQAAHIVPG